MADKQMPVATGEGGAAFAKLRDMGDGTFAEEVVTAPVGVTLTQTVIAITTASQQLIAANPNRKSLKWMVVGTANVTVVPGSTAAVLGAGMTYNSGGANAQGGSEDFPAAVPTNAFQFIGSAASSGNLIVWEGV